MASRRCTRKQIVKMEVKKCGNGKTKYCPVLTVNKKDRRSDIRTKGGGRLVDGGTRIVGGYKTKSEAQRRGADWVAKHNGTIC